MAVRWPDGSYTGSVRVGKRAPTPVDPEPENNEPTDKSEKEVKDGSR